MTTSEEAVVLFLLRFVLPLLIMRFIVGKRNFGWAFTNFLSETRKQFAYPRQYTHFTHNAIALLIPCKAGLEGKVNQEKL